MVVVEIIVDIVVEYCEDVVKTFVDDWLVESYVLGVEVDMYEILVGISEVK